MGEVCTLVLFIIMVSDYIIIIMFFNNIKVLNIMQKKSNTGIRSVYAIT